jgi:hypothetical protein
MKQTAFALAAAALVAVVLPPPPASARCHGCGIAAGVVGGVAAGAIIGSAIAGAQPAPVYVAPPPPPPSEVYYDEVDHPVCHVEHRRTWVEGYGWRSRRVEVCE